MRNRNPLAVLFLPYITFGIYSLIWMVQTKRDLNEMVGTTIPTSWLLIVPIANLFWLWKYSEAVEELTYDQRSALGTFLMVFCLGFFGLGPVAMAILQSTFNGYPAELEGVTRIRIGESDDDVTVYHVR